MLEITKISSKEEIIFGAECFEKAICEIENTKLDNNKIELRIKDIEKWAGEDHTYFAVARKNGILCAFNSLWITSGENNEKVGKICLLYVLKEYRKTGISSAMKKAGEEWLKQRGINKVITEIDARNTLMLEINKKNGFKIKSYNLEKNI